MKSLTMEDIIQNDDTDRMKRFMQLTQGEGDCYYFKIFKKMSSIYMKQSIHSIFEECPICLNPIKSIPSAWITWCGHMFHKSCLRDWSYTTRCSGSCPMCRQEMGSLEFLDGVEYAVYPRIENFCDLLEEIPNIIHRFCYNCNHVMGMNHENCEYCHEWIKHPE